MKFFTSLFPIAVIASNDKGTCVDGVDPIGLVQECLGRCHIYHAGEYGACFSYQFTEHDITGECGSSPATACKSTFNAGWNPDKSNCGNCYLVELPYEDGTVKQTYIKVVDTNGSETKFEMGQKAWENLCPYVCAGTGDCAHTKSSCTYGVLPEQPSYGGPISCAVQHAPIRFKRVDCDGTTPVSPTAAPVSPTAAPVSPTAAPVLPTAAPVVPTAAPVLPTAAPVLPTAAPVLPTAAPVLPTAAPVPPTAAPVPPTVAPFVPVVPTVAPFVPVVPTVAPFVPVVPTVAPFVPVVPTVAPVLPTVAPVLPTAADRPSVVSECKAGIGHSTNPTWAIGCQNLCEYYHNTPIFCTGFEYTTCEGLIGCIQKLHSYCEKI